MKVASPGPVVALPFIILEAEKSQNGEMGGRRLTFAHVLQEVPQYDERRV